MRYTLDEDLMIKRIIEAVEIILYYHLNSTHYTREDYNLMVEWKDHVRTYLYSTATDNIATRRLFERFENTL